MYIFQIHHYIKSDQVEAYIAATLENARQTMLEPGVIRFDVFQDAGNPTHFSLLEVYQDLTARDNHLKTEHFLKWREVYLQTQERKGNGDEFNALFPDEERWVKDR
jgi:(4S)-4-hydroxy-5-phosphonooxypentane-2,3-dione isomerase